MFAKCLQDDSTSLEDQDHMIEKLRNGATDQKEVKFARVRERSLSHDLHAGSID